MEIFRGSWSNFCDTKDSMVTVGHFDGLHIGHRAIIDQLTQGAKAQNLRSVLVTFDTHPRDVVQDSGTPVPQLTTLEEKLELLSATDVDLVLVVHFDHALSQMSATDFVQIVLKGRIGMRKIVAGFNHGFGKKRSGDRETLIAMARSLGFGVEVVNPCRVHENIVSSTYVREVIAAGDVAKAAEGLGRPYSLRGLVVRGFGRGKRLHWPTANMGNIAPGKLCPRDGIYAGLAKVRGEIHPAAISSGFNPTFTEGKHSLEAHLIGFDGDIYNEPIEFFFIELIRTEKKFSGEHELSAQIAADVSAAAEILRQRDLLRVMPAISGGPGKS